MLVNFLMDSQRFSFPLETQAIREPRLQFCFFQTEIISWGYQGT